MAERRPRGTVAELHGDTYREMTQMLMQAAGDLCGGSMMMSHEGGYSAFYVPYCEQLPGIRTHVDDAFLPVFKGYAGQSIRPHEQTAITEASRVLERFSR